MDNPSDFSYKDLHEAFISNHAGTTPLDIFLNLTTSIGGTFICHLLKYSYHPWMKPLPVQFFLEFAIIVVPQLWAFTHGCDYADMVVVTMLIVIVTLHLPDKHQELHKREANRLNRKKFSEQCLLPYKTKYYTFVTNVRTTLLLTTLMCILAVDFPVFPRRFAKAETYGFGLMDVGVGSFVFSNAGVAPETVRSSRPGRRLSRLKKSVISSVPILLLGFGRLLTTNAVDYHAHVSEYGVHWNFFFTLAVTKTLSSIVFICFPAAASCFLAVFLGIGYQVALHMGLRNFALFGSDGRGTREGLLDANREGLISCLGYMTLYLSGVSLHRFIYNTGPRLRFWMHKTLLLGILLIIFACLTWVSHHYIEEVSRRLANLTYILWMITFQLYFLCLYLIIDLLLIIYELKKTKHWKGSISFPAPTLLGDAMQYNGLWVFLCANLLTGLINLSVPTIKTSSPLAIVILVAYMLSLCSTAVLMRLKNVQMKFW